MSLADRLWAKVDKSGGPDACWLWTGHRNQKGYGKIGADRKTIGAHRGAWMVTNGPIPDGLFVLHRCDNPPCCNPAHLFVGTNADNMTDMAQKGRRKGRAMGDSNGLRKHPESRAFGDRNAWAKHPERMAARRSGSRTHPERLARGDANGSRLYPERLKRGEDATGSKLTEESVRQIRSEHASGATQKEIAARHGVSQTLVSAVVRRVIWKHVA